MTMSKITAKLRRKNQDQYRLLGICIFLSVLLVSSFTMMYFSPSVQQCLPPGGDTRKLMWLMLGVVVIGCVIFTLYGSSLFFRKKSREFGVMLALGAEKKELAGQLAVELSAVVGKYVFFGILLALPVSFLIWKLFRMLIINTPEMGYSFGIGGVFAGLLFAAVLSLCVLFLGKRFIRRANIMDILNAGRKTEMVREIRPWTGKLGMVLIITGLILAMAVPQITVVVFRQGMPAVWNVTYLLSVAGLYMVLLSAVGRAKKGKHPEKFYKNIISTNLMRFTARQTTRNMCVISLLVFVMVLSAFWGVMYYYNAVEGGSEAPYDYSIHYPAEEDQIGQEETERIADEYGVRITSYEQMESLELIVRYTGRDMNDQRQYFDVEYEKLASFISASDFSRISGIPVSLGEGEYQTVVQTDFKANVWVSADCLNEIEHPATGETMTPKFQGTVEFDNLAIVSDPFAFVLSDRDYQRFSEELTAAHREVHVLFNAEHGAADSGGADLPTEVSRSKSCTCGTGRLCPAMFDFADAWKQEYVRKATPISKRLGLYDVREEELALAAGTEYGYAGELEITPDSSDNMILDEWKYAPFSKIILQANAMEMVAVFVLLSLYVSIISLTAAGIMSYIRSITIAMDNRQLFEDLKKLGADDSYRENVIRVQLRKIFVYPVATGCTVVAVFSLFMTCFNDMRLQASEVRMLLMEVLLMAGIAAVLYVVYRMAYGRTKSIVGIGRES